MGKLCFSVEVEEGTDRPSYTFEINNILSVGRYLCTHPFDVNISYEIKYLVDIGVGS